jgi:hypothetical protein
MRDLIECKAEIRRQIDQKEKRRSILHKRWISSLSICTAAIICFCTIIIVPYLKTNHKTVKISNDNLKMYDSLEGIVKDSDLIFIGTVKGERTVFEDLSSPETIKTEYSFTIERQVIGDYDDNTIVVTSKGGTVGNVSYVLEGSEKYVVGERYIVFLSRPISEVATAVFFDQYVETSQLTGKIRINEGRIDTNAKEWNNNDDFSSIKNVDEFVQLIRRIKEN